MLRRLHPEQPESFAFTPENQAWAEAQITKYPEGRQASAIILLLWRAHEQEGWLSRAAIEHVAAMLDMAYIRALEVATFYFMFQLQPVGSTAHIQICGTTSCMICGAEDLVAVCKEKIASRPHQLSADRRFSWEEVECLGACSNAPMAQIGKDYYEDLTADRLAQLIDDLATGVVPQPGPQNGRFASEPKGGLTSLMTFGDGGLKVNASVQRAIDLRDTVKRIDGTEEPLVTPWISKPQDPDPQPGTPLTPAAPDAPEGIMEAAEEVLRPVALPEAREGKPDDLKKINGIDEELESILYSMGFYHYDQIATWTKDEVDWVDANLVDFKGRASRDGWVEQARRLMKAGARD